MSSVSYFCPAKLNLFLKIVGHKNNYHELESVFSFLDLGDNLEVSASDSFKIESLGEFGKSLDKENNIFITILNFFHKEFNISKNLNIKITKNIPISAGLGGGSSNGAFFIMALNKLFSLGLSIKKLQEISLNFGSDTAFFFEKKSSIIRGRGEIIKNLNDLEEVKILLINPKIALSTKEVFSNFDRNFSSKTDDDILMNKDVLELCKMINDLEKPAISIVPEISNILNNLKNHKAQIAKMSGSGASFGIFESDEDLEKCRDFFLKNFENYFVTKTKIIHYNLAE